MIKKSGDTLALKVLTVNYPSTKQQPKEHLSHYASTTVIGTPRTTQSQPPSTIPPTIQQQINKSPTDTLQSNKIKAQQTPTQQSHLSIPADFTDGTKSLPHKNKRMY